MLLQTFRTYFEVSEGTMENLAGTVFWERYSIYPKILEFIIRSIHFHRRKGLALREHEKSYKKKLTIKT